MLLSPINRMLLFQKSSIRAVISCRITSSSCPTVSSTFILKPYSSQARNMATASDTTTTSTLTSASSEDVEYEFELPEDSFKTHNFEMPPLTTKARKSELLSLYHQMMMIRRLETACDQLYKSKLIRGFCHLSTGQEAVACGMEAAITKEDSVITAYRCHGFAYLRGSSPLGIIAELMGRKAGSSKGKGGSMHLFASEFYGGNGIVGAQVPLGAGLGFAHKYRNKKTATFALYGDGAANQGQVFEAYNMAKLWDLPVVFVCENNQYGMGTSAHRASASTKYYTRGDYIPGLQVNGMDVLVVREACQKAREWCVNGNGPLVMEMVTYRYGGHSMSDPGTTYRSRDEIQHMRSTRDCITGLRTKILKVGAASEDELKKLDKDARAEIDEAVNQAKASPEPDIKELFTEIYAPGSIPEFIRGVTPDDIWTPAAHN